MPSVEIAEPEARGMLGRRVRAEFDDERHVHVRGAQGSRAAITDENMVERRPTGHRQYRVAGVALAPTRALVPLLGLIRAWRKVKRMAAAG